MDRKDIVTSALDNFLKTHLPHSSIGAIDDIVLNYLVGILEDVGNEDGFDVEDFMEMMDAYIPGFGDITSATVCEWIFQLSDVVLSSASTKETTLASPSSTNDNTSLKESVFLLDDIELPYRLPPEGSGGQEEGSTTNARSGDRTDAGRSSSSTPSPRSMDDNIKLLAEMFPDSCKVKVKRCLSDSSGDVEQVVQAMLHQEEKTQGRPSSASNKSNKHDATSAASDANVKLLKEMFPGSSELQARQCLSIAKGDLEQASQVLLDLQESGRVEDQGTIPTSSSKKNDKHLKESLLQKYGYVDTDDDRRNHKPMDPKKEKKKMVRYINSQMVTTKGERFVETKKPEPEEMKKTYTNLKPARKYHFH